MNKTLLLILCDFLLLTILSMLNLEKEDASASPAEGAADASSDASIAAMAMMEKDLLDTLKFSLEEEEVAKADLAANLDEKAAELQRTEQELQKRESRIEDLQQNLSEAALREHELQSAKSSLEEQAEELAKEVAVRSQDVALVSEKLQETELRARQTEAQSRALQEELRQRLADIEKKEVALSQANQQLASSQARIQELDTTVKMVQQEKRFLQESVETLKEEVVLEREERQKVQEQAGELVAGVTKLAESSQDLRQELRSSIPINANQLFAAYQENQIDVTFDSLKYLRNRYAEVRESSSTVIVSDGVNDYALMHIDNSPIGLRTNPSLIRSLSMTLGKDGHSLKVPEAQFLALDPRVMVVPLSKQDVSALRSRPYLTALEPYKFQEAVLVNSKGDYYGEVEFKLDAETPGFVKMQSRIFSKIFGEFAPSTGDIVLSKTGELLGIMVNRRYCVVIDNLLVEQRFALGERLDETGLRATLTNLNNLLDTFPQALR